MAAVQHVTAEDINARYGGKKTGSGYNIKCPCHDDKKASLSVSDGENGKLLLYCFAGCKFVDVAKALNLPRGQAESGKRQTAVYAYHDADGTKLSETVRYILPDGDKDFFQRKNEKEWTMKGVKRVPYRLRQLNAAIKAGRTVHDPEGEKDADSLAKLGFDATTNQGGANNLITIDATAHYFKGADVVVWADNDPPKPDGTLSAGETRAQHCAQAYTRAGAKRVRIAHAPAPHKDVSDWIAAGATADDIQRLADSAPDWTPDASLETVASEPRFPRLTLADIRALPPLSWLVEGELPAQALAALYAPPNAGKTFIALWRYALPQAQRGPVVIVTGEGLRGFADRVDAYLKFSKLKSEGQLIFSNELNLFDSEAVAQFITEYQSIRPILFMFDTLAMCSTGADENSAKDMGVITHNARRIVNELGSTVLLIHHTGKSGATERGSSRLRSDCDVMIELEDRDGTIALSCNKMRDAARFEARYLRLIPYQIDDTRGSMAVVNADRVDDRLTDKLTAAQLKILETLAYETFSEAGAKAAVLIRVANVSETTAFRALSTLKRLNYITQSKSGDPYFIAEKGKQLLSSLSRHSHDSIDSAIPTTTTTPTLLRSGSGGSESGSDSEGSEPMYTPVENDDITPEKVSDKPENERGYYEQLGGFMPNTDGAKASSDAYLAFAVGQISYEEYSARLEAIKKGAAIA